MLDINKCPTICEISKYINNKLFEQFFHYINEEYKALSKIEYSKDSYAQGWNIKLRKGGKSLCVIYPKKQYFTVLVVVGKKEKEKVEIILPSLSKEIQEIYVNTIEGNGQRWLMIDLVSDNELYYDVLKLIKIRRECK